jgi:Fe-S cluster assembly protein SufD
MSALLPQAAGPGRSIAPSYAAAARGALPGGDLPWLVADRDAAMARFAELGLPGQKVEEWKYSNLAPLAETEFTAPDPAAAASARAEIAERFPREDGAAARLVFVNGMFDGSLSVLGDTPAGVRVAGVAEAMARDGDLLEAALGSGASSPDHALAVLNTALMADGCVIAVDPGAEYALDLLFIAAPDAGAPAYHPRLAIAVGAGGQLSLRERHAALGGFAYWSNPVCDIRLAERARMRHYKLQEESALAWQTALVSARVSRGGAYENFTVATGGRYTRNEVAVALEGERASCELGGGFLLSGEQHVDNRLRVDHKSPEGVSRQSYKGVLDERAHGVFQGKTVVHRDAQKSDGNQMSRALLLSPDAVMDAKPELEIYADDVKCGHGATVGELDGEQMFYLRARGIGEAAARRLLIAAFMEEHVQAVSDEAARDWLAGAVHDWLARRETKELG